MPHPNDNLAKVISSLNQLEAFFRRLKPIQDIGDDRLNPMLRQEVSGVYQVLVRTHSRTCDGKVRLTQSHAQAPENMRTDESLILENFPHGKTDFGVRRPVEWSVA